MMTGRSSERLEAHLQGLVAPGEVGCEQHGRAGAVDEAGAGHARPRATSSRLGELASPGRRRRARSGRGPGPGCRAARGRGSHRSRRRHRPRSWCRRCPRRSSRSWRRAPCLVRFEARSVPSCCRAGRGSSVGLVVVRRRGCPGPGCAVPSVRGRCRGAWHRPAWRAAMSRSAARPRRPGRPAGRPSPGAPREQLDALAERAQLAHDGLARCRSRPRRTRSDPEPRPGPRASASVGGICGAIGSGRWAAPRGIRVVGRARPARPGRRAAAQPPRPPSPRAGSFVLSHVATPPRRARSAPAAVRRARRRPRPRIVAEPPAG